MAATVEQVLTAIYESRFQDNSSAAAKAAAAAIAEYNAALDKTEDSAKRNTRSTQTLINLNDAQTQASKRLVTQTNILQQTQAALAADAATGGARQEALARAIEGATAKVSASIAKLADLRGETSANADAVDNLRAKYDPLYAATQQSAQGMRLLGIQAIQTASGIATGQPVLTTLIQQGHQVADSALAMGASFKDVGAQAYALFQRLGGFPALIGVAVVGSIASLIDTAERAATRMSGLRDTLRLTSENYAGLATNVDTVARKIAASSNLSFAEAFAAASTISTAKYFAGTEAELDRLTRMADGVGKILGGSVAEGANFLAKAIANPSAAAKELADKGFPAMNAELLRTVERLQNAGQGGEALKLVLAALGPAVAGAVKDISPLKAALDDLSNVLTGTKGGTQGLGAALGEALAITIRNTADELRGLLGVAQRIKDFAEHPGPGAIRRAAERAGENQDPTDFSQPIFGQNAPVVTRVTPAFRGSLLDAANRENLDPELLARLHLVEGVLNSDGTWKRSPTGAIGPMQVTGSTFRGLQRQYPGDFGGQDVANPTTNANASARLFSDLLTKYGDVKIAVLAYHDGEGVVDDMLAGRGQASQAGLDEARKVTKGYGGTGRAPSRADPGSFAGIDYVPPAQAGTSRKPLGFAGAATGAGAGPVVGVGVRNDARANQDELNSLVQDSNAVKLANNADKMARLNAQIEDLRRNNREGTAEYAGLIEEQGKLAAASNQLISPQEKFLRGQQDQIAAGAGLYAGDQKLIALRQQMAQVERDQGGQFSASQRADAESNALRQLSQEFNRTIAAQDLAIASNDNIAAAYGQGYAAVAQATVAQAAYSKSVADFPKGSAAQVAAQAKLTEEAIRTASSLQNLKLAQDTKGNEDQLAYLQKEASLIGVSTEKREAELAVFKARQEAEKAGVPISEAALSANLRSVEALSRQSALNKQLESSYADLANIGVNAFTQVGDAIVEALAQGSKKTIDFGDVFRGVLASILKQLATLAIINPILNTLFGGSRSTLMSGLGVLLGGAKSFSVENAASVAGNGTLNATEATSGYNGSSAGAGLASAGSGTASAGIGAFGLISAARTAYEAVTNIFTTGGSTLAGLAQTATSYLASGITSLVGNGLAATNAAITATTATTAGVVNGTAYGVATASEVAAASVAQATGASTAATAAAASAASTITAAIPYIGAAITLGTELLQGNWRGAAFVAAGAAIGTVILPGIGTALGAAAGALVDAFFPQHAKNPYLNADLNVSGGQLALGKVNAQIIDPGETKKSLSDFASGLNKYMDDVQIKLANADGRVVQFGVNMTAGKGPNADQGNLVNSIEGVFKALRFTAATDDGSNLAIAKAGALPGQQFTGYEGLRAALIKIANFSDGLDLLGLQLKSVGNDVTNIEIAGLKGPARGDFQTALAHDLPGQTFATLDAFQAEVTKVAKFVGETVPTLSNPVIMFTSQLQDQIAKLVQQYADAIAAAQRYGLATDALTAGQVRAIAQLQAPALKELAISNLAIVQRGQVARGQDTRSSTLATFDLQADQQRTQLADAYKNIYGSLIPDAQEYGAAAKALEETLAAERVALVKKSNDEILAAEAQAAAARLAAAQKDLDSQLSLFGQLVSIRDRHNDAAAGSETLSSAIDAYNIKAIEETKNYSRSLLEYYGQSFAASADYHSRMKELESTQGAERLAVVKRFNGQMTQAAAQAYTQARSSVLQAITGLADYAKTLQTSAASPLAPQAQYRLALDQFRAVSGAAAAGNFNSLQKLQGYSDALLTASRTVNGSGTAYADDYKAVLAALQSAATAPVDKLTDSAMKAATEEQTRALSGKIDELKAELVSVRRELQQQTRAPAKAA